PRVCACPEWNHLNSDVRTFSDFPQSSELFGHHITITNNAMQNRLIKHNSVLGWLRIIQKVLAGHSRRDSTFDIAYRGFRPHRIEYGTSIPFGLQQPRHEQGLECA